MSGGKGAQRRGTRRNTARKAAAKKAAKQQERAGTSLTVSPITEDDLLAFQIAHFGDDGQPSEWFIDADTALNYDPGDEEDGLGYYEDGVKRTLTDEQIEIFRHSEMEMMDREAKAQAEEQQDNAQHKTDRSREKHETDGPISPVSVASSVEEDLLATTAPKNSASPANITRKGQHRAQPSTKPHSTDSKTRSRAQEVPYEQRHKRKWEAYIDENDPIEGSLTHRRIVRELDEQRTETVDLDY